LRPVCSYQQLHPYSEPCIPLKGTVDSRVTSLTAKHKPPVVSLVYDNFPVRAGRPLVGAPPPIQSSAAFTPLISRALAKETCKTTFTHTQRRTKSYQIHHRTCKHLCIRYPFDHLRLATVLSSPLSSSSSSISLSLSLSLRRQDAERRP
jgi:hypothetical protein